VCTAFTRSIGRLGVTDLDGFVEPRRCDAIEHRREACGGFGMVSAGVVIDEAGVGHQQHAHPSSVGPTRLA